MNRESKNILVFSAGLFVSLLILKPMNLTTVQTIFGIIIVYALLGTLIYGVRYFIRRNI